MVAALGAVHVSKPRPLPCCPASSADGADGPGEAGAGEAEAGAGEAEAGAGEAETGAGEAVADGPRRAGARRYVVEDPECSVPGVAAPCDVAGADEEAVPVVAAPARIERTSPSSRP